MLFHRIYRIIFLSIFLCIHSASSSWSNPHLIPSIIQKGDDLLAQGHYNKAVDEYVRALLIDMSSEEAHKGLLNLSQLNLSNSTLKTKLIDYRTLNNVLYELQEDIQRKTTARDHYIDTLRQQGVSQDQIERRLRYLENLAYETKNSAQETIKTELKIERDPMNVLIGLMRLEQETKFSKLSYLDQQLHDLQALEYALNENRFGDSVETFQVLPTERFYNARGEKQFDTQTKTVLRFADYLDLRKSLITKDEKMNRLSAEIIDLSLQLSEKDMELAQLSQTMESVQTSRSEVQQEWKSRFELSEEMIKRKDKEIESLEGAIANLKIDHQQKEDRLVDDLSEKEIMIEALGKEIFALSAKVEYMKEEQHAMATERVQSLSDAQYQAAEYQLSMKDEKLAELEGVLQLYKDLLGDVTKASKQKDNLIEKKDVMISQLRSDVDRLENRLVRQGESSEGYRLNLENLQNQLNHIQEKISSLQNESDSNLITSPALRQHVIEMEAQLSDLNQFIQQELQQQLWPNFN